MEQVQSRYATLLAQAKAANEEKRKQHRRRVLKAGTILFNNGYSSFGCKIRNLSDEGALLIFSDTTGIPSNFDFKLSDSKDTVAADRVWHTRTEMGIRFA